MQNRFKNTIDELCYFIDRLENSIEEKSKIPLWGRVKFLIF